MYGLNNKLQLEIMSYLDFLHSNNVTNISELLTSISEITTNAYRGILENCAGDYRKETAVIGMYDKVCDDIRAELVRDI